MSGQELLARRFEDRRAHLRAVAYRMLGSAAEAEDAVQEAWLRLAKSDTSDIENLDGWLTTVVSRICLDLLRTRTSRREDPLEFIDTVADSDPEHEAVLIDSVGRALLVVLDTLGPDERVAFVLHDMFAVPFDEIAPVVGRTTATTKKLASRARVRAGGGSGTSATAEQLTSGARVRAGGESGTSATTKKLAGRDKVRAEVESGTSATAETLAGRDRVRAGGGSGTPANTEQLASGARVRAGGEAAAELGRQREIVEAFLAAAREGDLAALLAVLAPDVVRTADPAALPAGMAVVIRGAQAVAGETVVLQRRSQFAAIALVDGAVGILVAPHGKLALALRMTITGDRVAAYEVIADPIRLHDLDIAVLPDRST
ncbi:sigma-70 family RNA polymerase sigma factor [Nocardia sp. NPDC050712]|uniref:sigma-70 family RNA polymerase sigma factor n=1 Tax=Nocardia sp. NPDC050712 TaxID=3155518 RepID=UPI0033C28171